MGKNLVGRGNFITHVGNRTRRRFPGYVTTGFTGMFHCVALLLAHHYIKTFCIYTAHPGGYCIRSIIGNDAG